MVHYPINPNCKTDLKKVFLANNNWYHFHERFGGQLRRNIVHTVIKVLSCKNRIRGSLKYACPDKNCGHIKYIPFTCKCRLCSSCGKKGTLQWQERLAEHFPDTRYQHITFTLPCEFWDLFWLNRDLFKAIAPLAVECLNTVVKSLDIHLGVFLAIHSFGADLKRNVHVHLLVALGGLTKDQKEWKKIKPFNQKQLVPLWRKVFLECLRKQYRKRKLNLGKQFAHLQHDYTAFNRFLDKHYHVWWHIHCAEPEKNATAIRQYLGRYVKRPPIANRNIAHCTDNAVSFYFKNRKTKKRKLKKMSPFEFIRAVIQHIPDKGFRMIRYYGFLSNALRGKCLPIVRRLLNLPEPNDYANSVTYASMMQQYLNFNPLKCVLCGNQLRLKSIDYGLTFRKLKKFHKQLALGMPCI